MTPRLIVGLGNPGQRYAHTRHNLGFRVLDGLIAADEWKSEPDVAVATETAGGQKTFFLKPQTLMNMSGLPIQRFVSFYHIPLDRLLVIHDDLDLTFGELRPAFDRGSAGHNGVGDIVERLGSAAFHRLRIGIGSNRESNLAAEDYVLQEFSESEEQRLIDVLRQATDWTKSWIRASQP